MSRIIFVDPAGKRTVVDARIGDSVMASAKDAGVSGITGRCGGALACATCHVYVSDQSAFQAVSDLEEEMLDGVFAELTDESRLSCQLDVTPECDGLVVRTPAGQG